MNSNYPNISCTDFFQQQLAGWPEAAERFRNLEETCRSKELPYEYSCLKAQFNPARVQSAKAKTDKQSIKRRSCFLCDDNRPKEQMYQNICKGYQLLVNPFPILPVHFTIVAETHRPQEILPAFSSYQMLLNRLSPYIVFYNGPSCGASAPDHMHFQAGSKGCVPIEARWETDYEPYLEYLYPKTTARGPHAPTPHYGIFLLLNYPSPVFVLRIHKDIDASPLFRVVYQALEKFSDTLPQTEELLDQEPMMNLLGWQKEGGEQIILIFPRSKHRPEVYYREDDQQMSVSPGAIDMGGLLIAISEQDYDRLTPEKASEILSEVGISREQSDLITEYITGKAPALPQSEPEIQVGILSQEEVTFVLNEPYQCNGQRVTGEQTVSCRNGELLWNGQSYPRLCLTPEGEGNFTLPAVTIGINFHWQQKEAQTFQGGIMLKAHEGLVVLINRVKAETYLSSVICSEMNSESPYEFLKASAIISRSWVLSQILQKKQKASATGVCGFSNEEEIIRWYEQSEHKLFDVCADDHCQRYQGISRITSERSRNAVLETRGEVLLFNHEICDARFSKCCGGATEEYRYCWDDHQVPYLVAHGDTVPSQAADLSREADAAAWISQSPECFCNTNDRELLGQILNHYDQSTTDFFRWTAVCPQELLLERLQEATGIDFGQVTDIVPIERGPGGRLSRIRIVGTKCSKIIGKELEIRRLFAKTHLYSAAFIIEKGPEADGAPKEFILHGAGWGHGVGMCQIGAAVMGKKGYDYRQILKHYYPHTQIKKLY